MNLERTKIEVKPEHKSMFKKICVERGYNWPTIFDEDKKMWFCLSESPRIEYLESLSRFKLHAYKEVSINWDFPPELNTESKDVKNLHQNAPIHNIDQALLKYPKGTVFNPVGSALQIVSSGLFEFEQTENRHWVIDSENRHVVFNIDSNKWAKVIRAPFEKKLDTSESDLIHELNSNEPTMKTGGDLIHEMNYDPIYHGGRFVEIKEGDSVDIQLLKPTRWESGFVWSGGRTKKGMFICENIISGDIQIVKTIRPQKTKEEKEIIFDKATELYLKGAANHNCYIEAINFGKTLKGDPSGYLFNGKFYKDIKELEGQTMDETNKPEPVYLRK